MKMFPKALALLSVLIFVATLTSAHSASLDPVDNDIQYGGGSSSILAAGVRLQPFTSSSHVFVPVPIRSHHTRIPFQTTSNNQLVRITYNAECRVIGNALPLVVSVAIEVDGTPAMPNSGTDFAFCSGTHGLGFDPQSGVRDAIFRAEAAGTHFVSVLAAGSANTTRWQLDDSILIVQK